MSLVSVGRQTWADGFTLFRLCRAWNSYLAETMQEWKDFYANGSDDKQDEICASWHKIFELNRYTPGWDGDLSKRSIQTTLWEVKRSQVIQIEHFIAKQEK